jgi:hypothetical protein
LNSQRGEIRTQPKEDSQRGVQTREGGRPRLTQGSHLNRTTVLVVLKQQLNNQRRSKQPKEIDTSCPDFVQGFIVNALSLKSVNFDVGARNTDPYKPPPRYLRRRNLVSHRGELWRSTTSNRNCDVVKRFLAANCKRSDLLGP